MGFEVWKDDREQGRLRVDAEASWTGDTRQGRLEEDLAKARVDLEACWKGDKGRETLGEGWKGILEL